MKSRSVQFLGVHENLIQISVDCSARKRLAPLGIISELHNEGA